MGRVLTDSTSESIVVLGLIKIACLISVWFVVN